VSLIVGGRGGNRRGTFAPDHLNRLTQSDAGSQVSGAIMLGDIVRWQP
jgi:hypothetical protein